MKARRVETRVPDDLRTAFLNLAAEERRTLSAVIILLAAEGYAARKEKARKAAEPTTNARVLKLLRDPDADVPEVPFEDVVPAWSGPPQGPVIVPEEMTDGLERTASGAIKGVPWRGHIGGSAGVVKERQPQPARQGSSGKDEEDMLREQMIGALGMDPIEVTVLIMGARNGAIGRGALKRAIELRVAEMGPAT